MPYVFHQGDLPKLDLQVDQGTDFMVWKLQWDSYLSLSGLAGESAAKQVQALTFCFSRDTLSIVQNLRLSEEEKGSVDSIICAMKRYIDGHVNETVERRNFRREKIYSHNLKYGNDKIDRVVFNYCHVIPTYLSCITNSA